MVPAIVANDDYWTSVADGRKVGQQSSAQWTNISSEWILCTVRIDILSPTSLVLSFEFQRCMQCSLNEQRKMQMKLSIVVYVVCDGFGDAAAVS